MKLLITLLSVIVLTFGMTSLIEMTVQVCNTMYSAGHNIGIYLNDLFN
jgi:hypothetical protein